MAIILITRYHDLEKHKPALIKRADRNGILFAAWSQVRYQTSNSSPTKPELGLVWVTKDRFKFLPTHQKYFVDETISSLQVKKLSRISSGLKLYSKSGSFKKIEVQSYLIHSANELNPINPITPKQYMSKSWWWDNWGGNRKGIRLLSEVLVNNGASLVTLQDLTQS